MDSMKYNFELLKTLYSGFVVPTVKIKIDGKEINKESINISEVQVEQTAGYEAGAASFIIKGIYSIIDGDLNKKYMDSYFKLGKIVEIEMGYITTKNVFKGYISSITVRFEEEEPCLEIECMDVKGIMMNCMRSEQKTFKKYSDAVKNVLQNYKSIASQSEIDTTEELERTIEQYLESDYEFVVRLAQEINYEFFAIGGTVYFRKPRKITPYIVDLSWKNGIKRFVREVSLSDQVSEVVVKSNDEKQKTVIKASAQSITKVGKGSNSAKSITKLIDKNKKNVIAPFIASTKEAEALAKAELDRLSMKFANVRATCCGLPEIIPGRFIKFSGLGKSLDNEYYILKATHRIDDFGYSTEIEAGVNMI
ncbi:phage late control D family protein [Defluviitalea saccharophila]|uniref:Contractile injection system protein, VgrG/Pvc8 family n=1 Tax=Defluviitalea saccharophila TaxID=879970 RepID=A0ABZ2Y717_9FIRM